MGAFATRQVILLPFPYSDPAAVELKSEVFVRLNEEGRKQKEEDLRLRTKGFALRDKWGAVCLAVWQRPG
jgi:hypothetical protein